MFKSITIIGGPIHAGKSFTFTNGETAIVGPNGCGKSLLAEYMAFALFGTVALRGKITDYKGLNVVAEVVIKGTTYRIERDAKTCKLICDKEILCLGTKPCNAKIISILGYDYNVYKMGNYAGQLDILGLGKMKPSERKTALDRTLGIGILDKLIKYANDIALKNLHESEALKSILVPPGQEPVPPTCYKEGVLNELYDEYISVKQDIDSYKEFQKRERPVEPILPSKPFETDLDSKQFLTKVLEKQNLEFELAELKKIEQSQYNLDYVKEQIELNKEYKKYLDHKNTLEAFEGPEPLFSEDKLDLVETNISLWTKYDEDMKNYNLQKVTCPKCKTEFNPFKEEPFKPFGERPDVDSKMVQLQRELIAKKKMREQLGFMRPVDKPELTTEKAYEELAKMEKFDKGLRRTNDIYFILHNSDFSLYTRENLERLQTYEKDLSVYNEKRTNFEVEYQRWNTLNLKYLEFNLRWAETRLNELAVYYENVRKYEEKKREYDQKKAEYDRVLEKALEMDKQETRYKTAVDNLKAMKIKIKGYVLPSLQKVSSILLSEMSDGLFQKIEIDPEFNILVEDREIGLFSGSEQAMINLALRLGLGQVLTHRAFSVFIGDEIDASMRDERAQLTADCLRKISKYINQVILISHRDIDADHFINLGDN